MANEEFGGEQIYQQSEDKKEEKPKEEENVKEEDGFSILEWMQKYSHKVIELLKKVLPDKGDEFADMLGKYSDLVYEFLGKFDDIFFTLFDVIDWLVDNISDLIAWVKRKINEKEEKDKLNQKGLYDYDLDDWIDYEEVDDKAKAMSQKYKDLLEARKDMGEDIDISKGLPSLEEMFADDLAYDFFKGLAGSEEDKEITNTAFYCQTPNSFNIGYQSDHTFILECTPSALIDLKKEKHLNAIDGDTYHFALSELSPTSEFTAQDGKHYNSFQHYCEANGLNSKKLQVRAIGIDCPEIPHYSGMAMKESQIKKMTIKEAKGKDNGAIYRKFNYKSGKDGESATVTERDLNTECSWYYDEENKKYFEISEFNRWDYYSSDSSLVNDEDYQCNIIVTQDDSDINLLADGYRARTVAYSVLENSQRIILKLDANGLVGKRTSGKYKLYYNHWWNADKAIAAMVEQWQNAMLNNAQVTRLSYAPLGTDGYGRFLGEVYCYTKIKGKMLWINLNKYVMSYVDATEFANESSPELGYVFGDNAKSFELWSYNKDNLKYLDSLEEATKESYQNRLQLHKNITGIDFKAFRACTMMLGDTLFLIPPTAIRNVSGVEYEKVNILRGKGSMVKGVTAREQYLEIDLYFYDEYGINGIPYDETLPNGQKMTYYMNGLRSLIAQFKVAPYLPIENQYINDILGIEAVSLVNLNINTVEGFPRLLQATLTLRDFNYRIYMPDIPFDYGLKASEDGSSVEAQIDNLNQITEMNPIFAKCFHWEIFRYYYQRVIAQGSRLAQYEYNTPEYNEAYYKSRNPLKPLNFCDKSDTISFYVPDEDWLSAALQIKKDRDYYGQMPKAVPLTDNGKDFFKRVGATSKYLKVNSTYSQYIADNFELYVSKIPKNNIENKNIFNTGNASMISYVGGGSNNNKKPESSSTITIPSNEEEMFKGYKKITVDGGNLSGDRQKNVVVDIGYGDRKYWGFTNEYGQLIKVVAKKIVLQDDDKEPVNDDGRYYDDEAKVPGTERDDMDEGHVIADSLGGVSNAYNITPQNSTLNRTGQQAKVEEEIRKAGGCTDFVAIMTYQDTKTQIPSHYSYSYTLNGNRKTVDFANIEPGTKEDISKKTALEDMIMDIANNIESSGAVRYDTTDEIFNPNDQTLTWNINFEIAGTNMSSEDIQSVKENLKDLMGLSSSNDALKDNKLVVSVTTNITNNKNIGASMEVSCPEIIAMSQYNDGDDHTSDVDSVYDYLNPAAMQFVSYIDEVPLQGLAFSMSNTFTEMQLKMMDGSAPQYMGASDISIELRIITDNSLIISMLNVLPSHSMNIAKQYRRIINCWPVRVRQNVLNMAGINEVLIDSVQIENLEGYPGVYDIKMRMTSVDRVMRNREMMMKLDSKQDVTTLPEQSISTYFDIQNVLAMAETYPDLDIPTLEELNQIGYRFLKYAGRVRTYPDPDFYMVYAFQYTAQIIKQNIKEVFIKNGYLKTKEEDVECNQDEHMQSMYADSTGQKLITELEATTGVQIKKLNGNAFYYTDAINSSDGIESQQRKVSPNYDPEFAGNVDAITMMTLYDVEEGWQIKPGWEATICPIQLENKVRQCKLSNLASSNTSKDEQDNSVYTDIFTKRKHIIGAIDEILSKPMPMKDLDPYGINGLNLKMKDVDYDIRNAVIKFLESDTTVKNLLKYMCPMGELNYKNNDRIKYWTNEASKFEEPFVYNFIDAYLFAAGCAQSGKSHKLVDSNWEDYFPKQYLTANGEVVKDDGTNDYKNLPAVPHAAIETAANPKYAKKKKTAIEKGFAFGMFQIKKETKDEIKKRIMPESQVDYLGDGKTFKFYEDYQDGFIDPYYNKLDKDSDELKQYIECISSWSAGNALAFLRIVLVYLRKQIIDGLIISDIDVMVDVYNKEIKETMDKINEESKTDTLQEGALRGLAGGFGIAGIKLYEYYTGEDFNFFKTPGEAYEEHQEENFDEVTGGDGSKDNQTSNEQLNLVKDLEVSYAQSFCARLILPFAEAACQTLVGPDATFRDLLYNRKLNDLNMLSATLLGASNTSGQLISKFLMALSGNVIDSRNTDTNASTTSDSQKIMNFLMREAFTELSEDPQQYLLHSFYDMLVNDKRGRLLRAFPTYYVTFIDEGRRIGSWKLFDNFYNMSAISELTVTKSRKIPTDTCSFVMTNMFGSYASEYDNASKVNYIDTYSIRDTFTSIFSPRQYITKQAAIKKRQENTEQTILKPGVRIHIRMGYGSDAAGLPVVFNGKIAEIDVGDVVTVIGQGDGTELVNPLNALGDIDATNLIESQTWCTLFKDLRGSLARGGLSPRNLLSQILTAEHGGVMKNFWRQITSDAYYSDNPFGIYHFGDKRFGEIFSEGEPTQNLYEVVDGTLLAGMNTLHMSDSSMSCSPTLNTTIQDKTFWDLLTMAAYSGVGYIGAIRDFGFRSTVCLCKRNHYYAYDYVMVDGKYVEKRKPFQQFHYYDSYTDIIYNSIKASEKNMKTNATGIWEGTDIIWGSEQKTCGPIYLDMNIYPEYQKSMTVDTGLTGVGNGGIDIPFITHFAEDWNLNANADKVNKTLAERITLNTLRESVSNMYTGELCVIGDPSVKPYDRISITDVYEDMCGQMEVEAVVYSMNSATGFTTTIYPDLIVRQDDPHEIATQQILGTVSAGLISVITGRIAVIAPLARISSKMVTGASAFFKSLFAVSGVEGGLGAGATAKICSFFKIQKGTGFLKSIGSALGSVTATTWVWMIVIAVTVFILTQNAKSALTRWIRNIQALDVYPIFKSQRPYIAGMNGHKGSVVGYPYTEQDADDSIQGIVVDCVKVLDEKALGIGGFVLNIFMNRDEYNATVANWSNTLTTLDGATPITTVEGVYQNALGEVSSEYRNRTASIQMLRTKYRLRSFDTNNGSDPTYLQYRILGVTTNKEINPQKKIEYRSNSATDITETSVFTNKNLLDLYPIEDDIDVKKAIAGTHGVVKNFKIAHSTGPITVNLPFESGSRIIRFIAETNPTSALSEYPILDMPMVQEDALYVLKFILNDQNMEKAKLEFTSGVRVNDIRTWKNTGFVFELHCNDQKALKKALDNIKNNTYWTINGINAPLFAYQQNGEDFVISVYPSIEKSTTSSDINNSTSNNKGTSNNSNDSNNNSNDTNVNNNSSTNNNNNGNVNNAGGTGVDSSAGGTATKSPTTQTYPNLKTDSNNIKYITNNTNSLVEKKEFDPNIEGDYNGNA